MNQYFNFNIKDSCELLCYKPKGYKEAYDNTYFDLSNMTRNKINLLYNKSDFPTKCVIANYLYNNNIVDFKFKEWLEEFDMLLDWSQNKAEWSTRLDKFVKRTAWDEYGDVKNKRFSDKYGKIICNIAEKIYTMYIQNKEEE